MLLGELFKRESNDDNLADFDSSLPTLHLTHQIFPRERNSGIQENVGQKWHQCFSTKVQKQCFVDLK